MGIKLQNNIYIILVRPQLGQNIGSVARAMKNFSQTNLRLVSPRDGWPNERAIELAVGAKNILEDAELFETLGDAVADLNFVYGCSARQRFLNKPTIYPAELAYELKDMSSNKIGILFGPENNGLDNEDISLTDKIVTIPVNPEFQSLNIAQSSVLVLYELFKESADRQKINDVAVDIATGQEILGLFNHLEEELSKKNFFKVSEKRDGMVMNIRSMFKRINKLSSQDVRTLRGIIKSLSTDSLSS
jgi:tRNA/rRNA methyltransferase